MHKDGSAPPTREAVRIIVRSTRYLQQAQASMPPGASAIQSRPLVDGLVSLPALDTPRAIKMLTEKDNQALGLSASDIYDLGLANLRRSLAPLMQVAKVAAHGQIGNLVGDPFQTSRLVLHDTWAPLVDAQGGKLIVAAPATDILLYVSEDTPVALDALATVVRDVMKRAPNRLSDMLLRWTRTGWEAAR